MAMSIRKNDQVVIRAGKDRKFQFLVGQVMKETKGAADARAVNELVRAKLEG